MWLTVLQWTSQWPLIQKLYKRRVELTAVTDIFIYILHFFRLCLNVKCTLVAYRTCKVRELATKQSRQEQHERRVGDGGGGDAECRNSAFEWELTGGKGCQLSHQQMWIELVWLCGLLDPLPLPQGHSRQTVCNTGDVPLRSFICQRWTSEHHCFFNQQSVEGHQ